MTLIQSWVDSLTLLKPKNFQLFVMVTIKSIIEAYKLYVRYFWWVIVLVIACAVAPYFFSYNKYTYMIFLYSSFLLYEILFLATCFSTRPSMLQKDGQYFVFQLEKIFFYWICLVTIFSFSSVTYYGYVFAVLFFADSEKSPKNFLLSLWNAIKMVVFNLPLMIIVGGTIYGLVWCGGWSLQRLLVAYNIPIQRSYYLLSNIVGALLLPITVCTFANIYIKRLHDQFDLYFNKAQ